MGGYYIAIINWVVPTPQREDVPCIKPNAIWIPPVPPHLLDLLPVMGIGLQQLVQFLSSEAVISTKELRPQR